MPVILLSYGKFKIRIAQNLTKETSRSSALSLNYHVNIGFLVKKKSNNNYDNNVWCCSRRFLNVL